MSSTMSRWPTGRAIVPNPVDVTNCRASCSGGVHRHGIAPCLMLCASAVHPCLDSARQRRAPCYPGRGGCQGAIGHYFSTGYSSSAGWLEVTLDVEAVAQGTSSRSSACSAAAGMRCRPPALRWLSSSAPGHFNLALLDRPAVPAPGAFRGSCRSDVGHPQDRPRPPALVDGSSLKRFVLALPSLARLLAVAALGHREPAAPGPIFPRARLFAASFIAWQPCTVASCLNRLKGAGDAVFIIVAHGLGRRQNQR